MTFEIGFPGESAITNFTTEFFGYAAFKLQVHIQTAFVLVLSITITTYIFMIIDTC